MDIKFNIEMPVRFDIMDSFITTIEVNVLHDISIIKTVPIATLKLYLIDVEGIQNTDNISLMQIFDSISNELLDIGSYFYDEDERLLESITDGRICSSFNLLFSDRFKIEKEFRHFGIGRVVNDRIIRLFVRQCGIMALKALPLQLESPDCIGKDDAPDDFDELPENSKKAFKQLIDHYGTMGFERYKKTDYLYLFPEEYIMEIPTPYYIDVNIDNESELYHQLLERKGIKETAI